MSNYFYPIGYWGGYVRLEDGVWYSIADEDNQ